VGKETTAPAWYTSSMNTTKPHQPRDWREGRRLRAWELHQQGWTGTAIAEALGVSKGAVSRWLKRAREGRAEVLRAQPPPGHTPRLTVDQLAQLPGLLVRGAEAFGFLGEVWTAKSGFRTSIYLAAVTNSHRKMLTDL